MIELRYPLPQQNYKVLCLCYTYNQANYIKDTLNGFAMQETNFPFACLVVEDCSTDGEQNVIKAWLERECDISKAEYIDLELADVIIVPHKTNTLCTFAITLLKRNLWKEQKLKETLVVPWREHCEYEALCEGDDYWIDPLKLQKQVNFLDSHPDYSMCFSRAKVLTEIKDAITIKCFDICDRDYSATELFKDWIVPTASILFRGEILRCPLQGEERMLNGDIVLVERAAHSGKVWGCSDYTVVYRMQSTGVTYDHTVRQERNMNAPDHYIFLKENFPDIERSVIDEKIAQCYLIRSEVQQDSKMKKNDIAEAYRFNPKLKKRKKRLMVLSKFYNIGKRLLFID